MLWHVTTRPNLCLLLDVLLIGLGLCVSLGLSLSLLRLDGSLSLRHAHVRRRHTTGAYWNSNGSSTSGWLLLWQLCVRGLLRRFDSAPAISEGYSRRWR